MVLDARLPSVYAGDWMEGVVRLVKHLYAKIFVGLLHRQMMWVPPQRQASMEATLPLMAHDLLKNPPYVVSCVAVLLRHQSRCRLRRTFRFCFVLRHLSSQKVSIKGVANEKHKRIGDPKDP